MRRKPPRTEQPPRVSRLLSKLLRTTFQVEPLEQRILLSADPMGAAVQALALRDGEHVLYDNGLRAAAELDELERAARDGARALQSQQAEPEAAEPFAVDAGAFDAALAQTRAAFMDSALALADPGYSRFIDGVLAVQVLQGETEAEVGASSVLDGGGAWAGAALPDGAQPGAAQGGGVAMPAGSTLREGELRLEQGLFDTARLAREVGSADLRALVVGPGATLAGSGVVSASTVVEGTLAPGYSPGLISYENGLTLTGATRTVIELGGTAPATVADAGAGAFHDRIDVRGLATLAGRLDIELVNGFTPKAGDEFVILDYDRVDGRFQAGEGLFGLHGNVWLELVQTGGASSAGQLKLVARELLPGAGEALPLAKLSGAAGVLDQIGQVLNTPYFGAGGLADIAFSADLKLGGFDIRGSSFELSWDADLARALLEVDAALDLGGFALSGDISVAVPRQADEPIEVSITQGALALSAGGARLSANKIEGGFVLSSDGAAGTMRVGSLALTDDEETPKPLAGIDLSGVRDVHLGFNTTGRAVQGAVGSVAFDYSAEEHHDFLAVDADLDLKLELKPVAYTLSGRFGLGSTEFVVDDTKARGLMLSVKDASTALAAAGVMLKLDGLQGGAVLGTVRGQFGTIGNVKVGAVALTRDDGSELIPGLSMLPLDLPFSFNTFDFTQSDKPAFSWPKFDLSALSFPYIDLSLPDLPSLNLPSLGSLGSGIDWSSLSLPELGALLPSFGGSLPGFELKLPNLTLPSLAAGSTGLGIDWPNLSLAQFVFNLPRLNLPGLKPDYSLLLEKFSNFDWATALPANWGSLDLSALLTDLKARIDAGSLPGLSLTLPDLSGLSLGGASLGTLKLADLKARLPSVDLDWAALSLPELLLSLPRLNLPGVSLNFDFGTLLPGWPDVSLSGLADYFRTGAGKSSPMAGLALDIDWGKLSLPELVYNLTRLELPALDLKLLGVRLPSLPKLPFDFTLGLPDLRLSKLASYFASLKGPNAAALAAIDWNALTLPQLVFTLPRLNLPGIDLNLSGLLKANGINWPDFKLSTLAGASSGLGAGIDWPNLTLPNLVSQLKGLNLPGLSITLPTDWGTLAGKKLADLGALFPDVKLDWPNLTLPELVFALPRLNVAGLGLNIDYGQLLPQWPNVSLPNLKSWLSGAGGRTGAITGIDWGDLSLPQLVFELPKLKLPGLDLGLLGLKLPELPFVGGLLDKLPFDIDLANGGFSISGALDIKLGDNLQLSGNFGFDRTSSRIIVLSQDATAILGAGGFEVGATGADIGLVIDASGLAFEAVGELYADLGGAVELGADEATIFYNSTGKSWTDQTLTIGSVSHTFGTLGAADLRGATLTGASLRVGDFIQASGNLAVRDGTQTLKVRTPGTGGAAATTADVSARVLSFGGSNLSAFAGVGQGADRTGLSISKLDLALVLASDAADAQRRWLALQAVVPADGVVGLLGVPELTLQASNLKLEVTRAATDGSLVDFALSPVAVATGSGTITIAYAASAGPVLRAAGLLTVGVAGFFRVQGNFAFERTTAELALSDGSTVSANVMTLGGKNISAFAGVNGGSADALGLDLKNADFALAILSDRANAARKWLALQSDIASAAFVGVDGLTVQGQSLQLAINRNLATTGGTQAQPALKQQTILRLDTDLGEGTLHLALGAQQAALALSASRSSESIRNELRRKLEQMLVAAGRAQADVDGAIAITGAREDGFTIVFGGALAGSDFSALTVRAEPASVSAGASERTAGQAARNNVTLTPVQQNSRLQMTLAAQAGTLRFSLGGQTADVALAAADTDAALAAKIDTALESLPGVGANTVTVTGTRASGYTLEFGGTRAGQDFSALAVALQQPALALQVSSLREGATTQTGNTISDANVRERQVIAFSGATAKTGVSYRLGFDGKTTGNIDFSNLNP